VRVALRAAAAAIPIYLAGCAVPDGGLFRAARFRDLHIYQGYAEKLLHGALPYRDVFVEYPPGAFAVFLPPAAFGSDHYNAAFKCLMALCGVATLVLVALVLAELGASPRRLYVALLLLALSPVALGPISLNTYDAWPALLTVLALWLLLREREVLGLMAEALEIGDISTRLGISAHTTRGYVQNILEKLGVHSKLAAVVRANALGVLDA